MHLIERRSGLPGGAVERKEGRAGLRGWRVAWGGWDPSPPPPPARWGVLEVGGGGWGASRACVGRRRGRGCGAPVLPSTASQKKDPEGGKPTSSLSESLDTLPVHSDPSPHCHRKKSEWGGVKMPHKLPLEFGHPLITTSLGAGRCWPPQDLRHPPFQFGWLNVFPRSANRK